MNIKKLGISALAVAGIFSTNFSMVDAETKAENKEVSCESRFRNNKSGLDDNQAVLFYMYSSKDGHYFLEPDAQHENVIFVGLNDFVVDDNFKIDTSNLHHGKRYVGTFVDSTLWELTGIKEVSNVE